MKGLCENCFELHALTSLLPTKEPPRLGTAGAGTNDDRIHTSGSKDRAHETSSRGGGGSGDGIHLNTASAIKLCNVTFMRQFGALEGKKIYEQSISYLLSLILNEQKS